MDGALRSTLARRQSDAELRAAMETLSRRPCFGSYTWLWGPALHVKDRVLFRPLILSSFMPGGLTAKGVPVDPWKGENAAALTTWLEDADRADDVEVFRRLYGWRLGSLTWKTTRQWCADVVQRFQAAPTRAARFTALAKVDLAGAFLDEATALALDAVDAEASRDFILQHLPFRWSRQDDREPAVAMWTTLQERALARGDAELTWTMYRRLVDAKTWRKDALALARSTLSADVLVQELEARHPGLGPSDSAALFVELVDLRGRDVVPYLLRHLRAVFPGAGGWGRKAQDTKGLKDLLQLARIRGWDDVWGTAVRTCSTEETFNAEVQRWLGEADRDEATSRRWLRRMTGAGAEWNVPGFGLTRVIPLTDEVAVALHARFPDLARGPFRLHLGASARGTAYPRLIDRLLKTGDETLLDFLTSRALTVVPTYSATAKEWEQVLDTLAAHFESLPREGGGFARRAAGALSAIPAYAVGSVDKLLPVNRLARLFFVRSDDHYLEEPRAVRDLLEAPEIHAQALAFRVLGRDTPRARALAAANVDLLQATLLRPLHRRTRLAAFRAVANAAAHDEDTARRLMPRLRDAFVLPDTRYPKDALVELLAKVLGRWPALRTTSEQPRVFTVSHEAVRA
ncbi:gliding motility protein [Myxococcus sp. K15C18031901]|uniref:gliding motility protein n=1 Tax=Myxococcus dinghuensis TaxID=2906761 RepID=UPI0020A74129|nr:gliding motility protein [Myxococcus dinghuensis]MCP3104754.1 gliding motility protein [Myxococcus dinghuensis]